MRSGEDRETEPALKVPDLMGLGFVQSITRRRKKTATDQLLSGNKTISAGTTEAFATQLRHTEFGVLWLRIWVQVRRLRAAAMSNLWTSYKAFHSL